MKSYSTYTDDELLQQYRRTADNEWLGVLLQRYTVLLLGVAMKYLKNSELAADAVQQVFMKALVGLPKGEIQNFKGWLYILMRNHCFQYLRDRKHIQGEEALQNTIAPEALDVQSLYEQEQEIYRMRQALEELEEGQRVCISLFYLEKKTYQQIMDEKGYSFMQVKSHIQNGKRRIRTIVASMKDNKHE